MKYVPLLCAISLKTICKTDFSTSVYILNFNVIIILMTKNELRKYIKTKIAENKEGLGKESADICNIILEEKCFEEASVVLGYMPLMDEVDVLPVIKAAMAGGKKIAVPRVEVQNTLLVEDKGKVQNQMSFYYLDDESELYNQVESGYCGINEPKTSKKQFSSGDVFDSVLVLVPGRAFTKNGGRLGRGKGFYDVFLKQLLEECKAAGKKVHTIGVCFSCQLVDSLPTEQNDIFVDMIVSP